MKKLLLFLLSITLIFSLVACGMQNGSSNEEKQNTPDENTLQSTEKEFSYKMVELPLEKYDMERVKAVLSYVIYTDANPSEHSDFAIYTKDGTNLLEDDSIYAKYETTYVCHECTLKHAQTTKGDDLNTHDRIIAIRLVFKDEVYASEDLAVKTILYNDIEAKTGQTIELTANATMADIKLNEKYIHTTSLCKDDDGNLAIIDPLGKSPISASISIDNSSPLISNAISIDYLYPFPMLKFEGEFELVDKNGNSINIPENCEKYFYSFITSYWCYGIKPIDSRELTEEQERFLETIHLKYTDKDGNITYFFN